MKNLESIIVNVLTKIATKHQLALIANIAIWMNGNDQKNKDDPCDKVCEIIFELLIGLVFIILSVLVGIYR